eukprot:13064038-Alexandrium_andersonii.AAC.1
MGLDRRSESYHWHFHPEPIRMNGRRTRKGMFVLLSSREMTQEPLPALCRVCGSIGTSSA